jgi:hypothetical protein
VHRGSLHTVHSPDDGSSSLLSRLVVALYLLGYSTLLPILTTILINWAVYYFTANTFFKESWMIPTLLGLSAFAGGVLIRQKVEDGRGGLLKFIMGMLGLILYAYITYLDVHQPGGIYSQYMPMFLRPHLVAIIYALPAIGLGGMLFYQYFSLKANP